MPRETPLLAATAAMLGLLLWSIWRIPMTTTHTAVLLYVIAGILEFVGVLMIGIDLAARGRRVRAYVTAQRNVVIMGKTARDRSSAGELEVRGGREPTIEERVTALEERVRGERDRTDAAVRAAERDLQEQIREVEDGIEATTRRRFGQIVALIGPNESSRPGWLGFAALLLGVLVGTAANILSATS